MQPFSTLPKIPRMGGCPVDYSPEGQEELTRLLNTAHTHHNVTLEAWRTHSGRSLHPPLRPFSSLLKMVLLYALKNLLVLLSITCLWYTGSLSMALPHLSLNMLFEHCHRKRCGVMERPSIWPEMIPAIKSQLALRHPTCSEDNNSYPSISRIIVRIHVIIYMKMLCKLWSIILMSAAISQVLAYSLTSAFPDTNIQIPAILL